ncbi:MAG: prenyltransferase/squalene oxidase repeat-containing protein [Pirellulaceae bacterium]
MIDFVRLQAAYEKARADLLAERTPSGHWEGELSSSALSTATAISALSIARDAATGPRRRTTVPDDARPNDADLHDAHRIDTRLIQQGIAYLRQQQNEDGGWGDTDKSHSNIATTLLVVAAVHLAGEEGLSSSGMERARAYIERQGGTEGLRRRYGRDKTFAVPILTNCALAGLIPWQQVAPLPFEWACIPQRMYRWARLPVVSYAIPALVAIGQARFFHRGPRFPLTRLVRRAAVAPSVRVLERMQPDSGGYLEAVPLTSFVAMSLAATGRSTHPVTRAALQFLRASVRQDGSWPIDTNLATWTTSLAINALCVNSDESMEVANLSWLLGCQHRVRHPFTGADPGGWGWTDLSGAVPDADDTAGALLACARWPGRGSLSPALDRRLAEAAQAGVAWLLDLQNRDGGWPTFCRGWGKLPFDRSGADLTAHAMRGLYAWRALGPRRIEHALQRGWKYLEKNQRPDGSWVPLWFGNQDHPQEENPVFGTARVLLAYGEMGACETAAPRRGSHWLTSVQRADGGWGGGLAPDGRPTEHSAGSVEETALALEALIAMGGDPGLQMPVSKGLRWLIEAVLEDRHRETAPIGFYFAKLWYHEKLYPLIFAATALGRAVHQFGIGTRTTHLENAPGNERRCYP